MPNLNYRRGANFERYVLEKYRTNGWDGTRSAGSHTAWDIVLWRQGEVILGQCQTGENSKYFSPAKRNALIEEAKENNFQAWLFWRENRKFYSRQIY